MFHLSKLSDFIAMQYLYACKSYQVFIPILFMLYYIILEIDMGINWSGGIFDVYLIVSIRTQIYLVQLANLKQDA